jgi:molecular chaperone IbpA
MRTTYDFAPLWRSTIGFDRLFDLVDAAQQAGTEDNYPPCNVERLGEDRYQISLAIAGFSPDEIAITAEQSVVTVEGRKAEKQQREFPAPGNFIAAFQAAIQSGGLCPGQGSGR